MAATVRAMFARELLRVMKDRKARTKDKLEAARLYVEISGKRPEAPPLPSVLIVPPTAVKEPSSLD
jgi:hypothetical protein